MSDRQYNQHGGVLVFVLVGVVLTALLAGGIYVSKNQGRAAVVNPAPITSTPEPKKPIAEMNKNDTPQQAPKKDAPATPQQNAPKQTTPPANTTPQPTTGIANTGPSAIATTGPSALPSTGPNDALFSVVVLGVLAATVTAYRLSSQRMHAAALK